MPLPPPLHRPSPLPTVHTVDTCTKAARHKNTLVSFLHVCVCVSVISLSMLSVTHPPRQRQRLYCKQGDDPDVTHTGGELQTGLVKSRLLATPRRRRLPAPPSVPDAVPPRSYLRTAHVTLINLFFFQKMDSPTPPP